MIIMDRTACHVIYVHRDLCEEGPLHTIPDSDAGPTDPAIEKTRQAVQPLLDAFGDGELMNRTSYLQLPWH